MSNYHIWTQLQMFRMQGAGRHRWGALMQHIRHRCNEGSVVMRVQLYFSVALSSSSSYTYQAALQFAERWHADGPGSHCRCCQNRHCCLRESWASTDLTSNFAREFMWQCSCTSWLSRWQKRSTQTFCQSSFFLVQDMLLGCQSRQLSSHALAQAC